MKGVVPHRVEIAEEEADKDSDARLQEENGGEIGSRGEGEEGGRREVGGQLAREAQEEEDPAALERVEEGVLDVGALLCTNGRLE